MTYFLEYVMYIYFGLCFGIEKQAQLNRHEVILKQCFLHVYSGWVFFPCSNFLFLRLLSVHFEWFACGALEKSQGFGSRSVFVAFKCWGGAILRVLFWNQNRLFWNVYHTSRADGKKMCQTTVGECPWTNEKLARCSPAVSETKIGTF